MCGAMTRKLHYEKVITKRESCLSQKSDMTYDCL